MSSPSESKSDSNHQLLKVNKYYIGPTLGEGTFGKVKQCKNSLTGELLAMKIIDKEKVLKHHMADQLKREISLMKKLRHENIIRMHEVLTSKSKVFIVLELAQGGELFQKIADSGRFDEKTSRYYFQQLIRGVDFCHQNGICHRDLKPENLLLDEKGVLKITDFGLCALSDADNVLLKTQCGTPNYTAPEILIGGQYDGKPTDVWSCGIILFVMLAGYLPFEEDNNIELFRKIKKAEFEYPSYFPAQPKQIINKILDPNPATRMTIADIKQEPWFTHNLNPSFFNPRYSISQMKIVDAEPDESKKDVKSAESKARNASPSSKTPSSPAGTTQPTVTSQDLQNAFQPVDAIEESTDAPPSRQRRPLPLTVPTPQATSPTYPITPISPSNVALAAFPAPEKKANPKTARRPPELTIPPPEENIDKPLDIQTPKSATNRMQVQVRSDTQFVSLQQPMVVMKRVREEIVKNKGSIEIADRESPDPKKANTPSPYHIHAIFPKAVGSITMKVDLYQIASSSACVVQFRRGKGSVIAFMSLFKKLQEGLKDVISEELSKKEERLPVPRTPQSSRINSPTHSPQTSFNVSTSHNVSPTSPASPNLVSKGERPVPPRPHASPLSTNVTTTTRDRSRSLNLPARQATMSIELGDEEIKKVSRPLVKKAAKAKTDADDGKGK
ncbi:putative CBL-interacting protein kinase 23 [Blattamonas nauphoetae]|uniref:non-specific serine/threonine protein kinase n=1 Tax=Blattamonas nauphoetae TaxID=2049346 RepID=A0ABQ9XJ75_9EUKA|nr:putative CBL-interacting protein kinase 23 [Blattamonas nauphoetae]